MAYIDCNKILTFLVCFRWPRTHKSRGPTWACFGATSYWYVGMPNNKCLSCTRLWLALSCMNASTQRLQYMQLVYMQAANLPKQKCDVLK